jgi:hypothetical protein
MVAGYASAADQREPDFAIDDLQGGLGSWHQGAGTAAATSISMGQPSPMHEPIPEHSGQLSQRPA